MEVGPLALDRGVVGTATRCAPGSSVAFHSPFFMAVSLCSSGPAPACASGETVAPEALRPDAAEYEEEAVPDELVFTPAFVAGLALARDSVDESGAVFSLASGPPSALLTRRSDFRLPSALYLSRVAIWRLARDTNRVISALIHNEA